MVRLCLYLDSTNPFGKNLETYYKRLGGVYQNVKPPCLIKNNVHITDPVQIAELMAHHYETVSGNGSYPAAFQRIRERMEHHLCFDTSEVLLYNSPITYIELQSLLSSCGSSASGEDNISYAMILKSHPTCLLLLLAIFNKVFSTGSYLSITEALEFSAVLPKARQVPYPWRKSQAYFLD